MSMNGYFYNGHTLCTYIHTYNIHRYVHTYTHMYIRTCMHGYVHTYVHTYMYAYIHTYHTYHTYIPYIHTYIHTYIFPFHHLLHSPNITRKMVPITRRASSYVFLLASQLLSSLAHLSSSLFSFFSSQALILTPYFSERK